MPLRDPVGKSGLPGTDSLGQAVEEAMTTTMITTTENVRLLTPGEVARLFSVDPKTVTRWAKAGKLSSIRTLGGHRRYRESEVRALLAGIPQQRLDED